jgi:hypothetical protein
MIKKITASMTLLKRGKSVADPAKWKSRQITATVLTGIIWSAINAAEAFGYAIPVDAETVDAVAVGFLALINWLLTLSTSKKVGM